MTTDVVLKQQLADLRELLVWNDDNGWDASAEEASVLDSLIQMKEELARLNGDTGPDAETIKLRERLAAVQAEIQEQGQEAVTWAMAAELKVYKIGPDVIEKAAEYFGSRQGYRGVEAYCRHRYSNYDRLLKEAPDDSNTARDILKDRVNTLIQQALLEVGISEWEMG